MDRPSAHENGPGEFVTGLALHLAIGHIVESRLARDAAARLVAALSRCSGLHNWISACRARRSVREDFERSAMLSPQAAERALQAAVRQAVQGGLSHASKAVAASTALSDRCWLGTASPDALRAVRRGNGGRPIRVSVAAIQPAAIKLLRRVAEKHDLLLQIESGYYHGPDQLNSLGKQDGEPDFLILPTGPFFLSTSPAARHYKLVLPMYPKKQELLVSRDHCDREVRRVFALEGSSGDVQIRAWRGMEAFQDARLVGTAEILNRAKAGLEPSEGLVAWDPVAAELKAGCGLVGRPAYDYTRWVSLFAHQRWLCRSAEKRLRGFQELLIAEAVACARDRSLPRQVVGDTGLWEAFRGAATLSRVA